MTNLPAPLVPADVDLRDFQGMWVDTDRLLKSDTWVLGNGDEKGAAMTLWLESWHQVPAASLPANDRILAKLSQADNWKRSREHALGGWVECSDGRLYHPVVAEKALEAWIEKLTSAINGAEGNAKRWQVSVDTTLLRDQLRTAVDLLRSLNAASRSLKKKAVVVILAGSPPESPPDVGLPSPPESPPDTSKSSPPDRKGSDQTRPDLNTPDAQRSPPPARVHTRTREAEPPPEANGHEPTPAGRVCKAMRKAGLQQTNPGDPRLLALLEQGATEQEFVGLAQEAVDKRISAPWPWVLKALEGRRAEAAAIALAPPTPKPGEPSGRMPEYVPPPALSADEKASSDAARRAAMSRLGRVAS